MISASLAIAFPLGDRCGIGWTEKSDSVSQPKLPKILSHRTPRDALLTSNTLRIPHPATALPPPLNTAG
ncbi:hypothetical protein RB1751 [Rhodopirellula baltica SH 1]|uniref:Uncharacterized protein n=1 Tax=Rhodopirellula baltica (strain DSM 10527 / NCIMB 13988 / SH1) TaxID=243090 RepID=Q7UWW1_RHOBA|nr:hypothetical protein RB1751 [Rhodopirellula baltica SH 1]